MRFWRVRRHPEQDVRVFAARDRASLLLAQSLLESAGIRFTVVNDFTQDIIDPGRVGTGFNLAVGPPTIWVGRADTAAAAKTLAQLQSYRPGRVPLWLRWLAICVLVASAILHLILMRLE